MCSDADADADRFFGEVDRPRRANWKLRQLCKQVERAASVALAEKCTSEALVGAAVVDVVPAPDASRLMVVVMLPADRDVAQVQEAMAALVRSTSGFRLEVARAIHRKRVPEVVFEVRREEEVARG